MNLGYENFADLVTADLDIDNLIVIGGVGSGASAGALTQYLRRKNPAVELVGPQPFGSITFGSEQYHDPEAIIAGIGSSIQFDNVRLDMYDAIHWIDFRHAMSGAVALLRRQAVFAGLSTGAAYLVAQWLTARDPDRTCLVIGADTGHRYVERVFARHREALDPTTLCPKEITSLTDLAMPWSAMRWDRRQW